MKKLWRNTDANKVPAKDRLPNGSLAGMPKTKQQRKQSKRITCPQCQMLMINGHPCHETGCPNSGARYDKESGEWIKQRECFECGCIVDANDLCCNDPHSEYGDE